MILPGVGRKRISLSGPSISVTWPRIIFWRLKASVTCKPIQFVLCTSSLSGTCTLFQLLFAYCILQPGVVLHSSSRNRVQTWLLWPDLPSLFFRPMLSPAGENAAITLFLHFGLFLPWKRSLHFIFVGLVWGFSCPPVVPNITVCTLAFLYGNAVTQKTRTKEFIYWKDETRKLLTSERSTMLYVEVFESLGHGAEVWYVEILGVCTAERLCILCNS